MIPANILLLTFVHIKNRIKIHEFFSVFLQFGNNHFEDAANFFPLPSSLH